MAVFARSGDEAIELLQEFLDCFAEACHRARIRATRWLAMTLKF
jgi:molybdenum cofactor biosynthesis enzyme MoaA